MRNEWDWTQWWLSFKKIVAPSILDTIGMVAATLVIGFICGFFISVILTITGPKGLRPNRFVYKLTDFIVNTIRSFPMLLFIVAIQPVTRFVAGTPIGPRAAIVPLSISCTMFIARLFENRFKETDPQLIEAARSFGASDLQIFFRVIVKEAVPSMITAMTMVAVTYLGMSTIAGTVGAGGLGAVALVYGYNTYNDQILYTAVVILFILVYIVQGFGDVLYKRATGKRENARVEDDE